MTQKDVRLVIKNSGVVNRPLPQSLLPGEAVVNTAEGIVFYSGVTTSINEWTPAGTGTTANFFEVGSNLYDLRLRNKIVTYEGETGVGLTGKFLSGTTNGFVLADVSNIQGVDSYVTGATWNPNQLTLNLNENKPSVSLNISTFGTLTITNDLFVLGELSTSNLTITGTGIYNGVVNGSNVNEIVNWSSLTAYTSNNDRYVTGGTFSTNTLTLERNDGNIILITGFTNENLFTTGGTYNSLTENIDFFGNSSATTFSVDVSELLDDTNTFTTGATLSDTTVIFDRNDQTNAYSVDLSPIIPIPFDCDNLSGCTIIQDIQNDIINLELDATFTIELIDEFNVTFYAPFDLKINTFTLINGSGTITIEVNNLPYTLGNVITQGSAIKITTTTASVVNLNVRYE
jgi:hypothetical protein